MSLIILDRDGVINYDSDDFIKSPAEWKPIEGSLEAIARLNYAGYRVIIITNQSAIAGGLLDVETLNHIHSKMRRMLAQVGGKIEAILFCPHGPKDEYLCRKPQDGSFSELASRLRITLKDVPAIGDSIEDILAAQAAGAAPILVRTGKGGKILAKEIPEGVAVYDDLAAVVDALLDPAI